MRRTVFGFLAVFALAAFANAGTITVTAPTDGSYIGSSNSIKFNITGASLQVTVTALVQPPGGGTPTTISDKFTPNTDGKIGDSLPLNFGTSAPEGAYVIKVWAEEPGNPYNATQANPIVINVTLDHTDPKLLQWNPQDGSYVKGPTVPITATVLEPNVQDWRIQIDNTDIPNNTGTGTTVLVNWGTSGIDKDGSHSINLRVRDLATNTLTRAFNVTLDRVPPVINTLLPASGSKYFRGQLLNVIVDIVDASTSSVDVTGVDVVIKDMSNNFVTRVPRLTTTAVGSTTLRWYGRIRSGFILPVRFQIVITAVDKAGNVGTPQTVVVGS